MGNWDNWFFLFLAVLISIPVGIFVNIVSPLVSNYLKNHPLSTKDRKILMLLTHYRDVVKYNSKTEFDSEYVVTVFMKVSFFPNAMALILLFSVNAANDVFGARAYIYTEFITIAMFPFLVYTMALIPRVVSIIFDALNFREYRSKTITKLKKLGGNPEELDRIDQEQAKLITEKPPKKKPYRR
jgi:hypothetical protein